MGILGINNRTENWKTVQHFHGLSDAAKVDLVRRLGEPKGTAADQVSLELFWCGVRDHEKEHGVDSEKLIRIYEERFGKLREQIAGRDYTPRLQLNKDRNYQPRTMADYDRLVSNVKNTEVDIALETPGCIFIGEAKYESPLDANSKYVLVHQLIRQYVTISILVDLVGRHKRVVPFVVTEDEESLRNSGQVAFMVRREWLAKGNVLTWGDINDIRFGRG